MTRRGQLLLYLALGWLALLGLGGRALGAQQVDLETIRASKQALAVRIEEPIEIDGMLDEPAWQAAQPATDFYQKTPDEGQPSRLHTEVRFLYDETNLYVGGILFDPSPELAITNELKRDFGGWSNDVLAVILDTNLDRSTAYGFMTNQGGAQRDTLAFDEGQRNDANWHGVWRVRTAVHTDSWTVEYAIPFKTLRFPDNSKQEWGLNILRIIRRMNEFSTWSPVPRQFSHYNVAYAGSLLGIEGVRPGGSLQVKPFVTAQTTHDSSTEEGWEREADGGVDIKYVPTAGLVLDLTYRTDFSQVEADQQQINLTRFGLFFPEKREFFLENPASFQIGLTDPTGVTPTFLPFFSRRIGLSGRGEPIPVFGGARLTGQAGGFGIGFLNMQTEDHQGVPGDNFTATRITRQLGGGFTVGGSYFGREASSDSANKARYNRVGGFDLFFSPSRTLDFEAMFFGSATDGIESDLAIRAGMRYQTDAHQARARFLHVGENFRNDLGFVRRDGVGTFSGEYIRTFRPEATYRWVRGYSIGPALDWSSDSQYEQWLTRLGGLKYSMEFADGGSFQFQVNRTFERLLEPFQIRSGVAIPVGDYTTSEFLVKYSSNNSNRLSGSVELTKGGFWSGSRTNPAASVRFRLNAHLATSASFGRQNVSLPEGSFNDDLASLRLDWSLSTRMFLNAFVQYNGTADAWFSNVRFNLIHRPLSDIFIVWNQVRSPSATQHALILKYTHMLPF